MNLRGVFRSRRAGALPLPLREARVLPGAERRAGGQACWSPPAATRCARRTCISGSPRTGYKPLITHIFVKGGKYLDSDAVFGVKPELIVDFKKGKDGVARASYDFVLMKDKK